jgi:hypothetical protein
MISIRVNQFVADSTRMGLIVDEAKHLREVRLLCSATTAPPYLLISPVGH